MLIAVWMLALASPEDVVTVADALEHLDAAADSGGNPGQPAGNPGWWVTNDDYPADAMRQEHEGISGFRLTYDATGRTTGCEITSSSGYAELDEATCRLLVERARFIPGHDAKGAQVGGTYTNRIRWQIPGADEAAVASAGFQADANRESWPRGPLAAESMSTIDPASHYPPAARAERMEGEVQMLLGIDAAGVLTSCDVVEGSMSADLDAAACNLMRTEGRFQPALDSDGKPVRGTLPANFRWVLPPDSDAAPDAVQERPLGKFPMSEPGLSTISVLVGADGQVAECKFSATGSARSMTNFCDTVGGPIRYLPFVDADGRPVAKRVIGRFEMTVEDAVVPTKGADE